MRICIYGAGAVGGYLAAKLSRRAHATISLVARGAHLQAIRSNGLILRDANGEFTVNVAHATDSPAQLPSQDLVIVTLKATALASQAEAIANLLAAQGQVLFLNNGIPWWWQYGLQRDPQSLPLLDPQGALWRHITPARVLGGVVYSPNEVVSPGVVFNRGSNCFLLGEPQGGITPRLQEIAALLQSAAIPVETVADLRLEIWRKLALNVSGNPLSALTRLTGPERAADPDLCALAAALVDEVLNVAAHSGWDLRSEIDAAALAAGAGQFSLRSSMLQDVLAGRPLEVDALLGQPYALAQQHGIATPRLALVLTLLRGLDRSLQR